MPAQRFIVLMAEDSEHDIRAIRRVWEKLAIENPLKIVRDGAECLDYLARRDEYADPETSPRPGVMLLDINLPKVDGFEILRQVRAMPELRRLPVVVLTTSNRHEDMLKSYELGANAFITKPVGMENLKNLAATLNRFWEMSGLPFYCADGQG